MSMRTINISLGGLKLEANFDLAIGESIDFAILTNGTRIRCKGRILGIEDLKNKVHARLRFAQISDTDFQKLANYLDNLSREKGIPFQRVVISGLLILVALIAYLIIRAYFPR
jgi:c-di-GMP-binding flagellar brake protein YcgR